MKIFPMTGTTGCISVQEGWQITRQDKFCKCQNIKDNHIVFNAELPVVSRVISKLHDMGSQTIQDSSPVQCG